MLYQLGSLTFEVWPFNTEETVRETRADFAAKDVLGSLRPREFMGEGDNSFTFTGRLFPEKLGGLSGLDALDAMRLSGKPQILVRGDGSNLGWWLVERVRESSSVLDPRGVGRIVDYEIGLMKSPSAPSVSSYLSTFLSLLR